MRLPKLFLAAAVVVSLAGIFSTGASHAEQLLIDFSERFRIDKSQFSSHNVAKPLYFNLLGPSSRGRCSDDAFRFVVDIATNFDVWLDPHTPSRNSATKGDRSLAFQISSDYDANVKDKVMMTVNPLGGGETLDVSGPPKAKFVSFDFMLDKSYEAPHNWLLHFQAWQCCAGVPPFSIHVAPNPRRDSDLEFVFYAVDDVAIASERYTRGREIYRMPVKRGEWNNMAIEMIPSIDDSGRLGEIAMWWNGAKKFDWRGAWGFKPADSSPSYDGKMHSDITLFLGTYRRRQTTTQIIYFDNIRLGDRLQDVIIQ